ncbi:hypothetical protein MRX96_020120 [Rhipicephalus microplus]
MVKLEQKVEFEAVVKDDVISVSAKAVEGLAATQDTSGNIFHNYAVLAVDNECLLLSRGQSSSGGKHMCMLWGLSKSVVNENTECYQQMNLFCTINMHDLTKSNSKCEYYTRNDD